LAPSELLEAENRAGYFGVTLSKPGQPKPYQAQVRRGGKRVSLGNFATADGGGAVRRAYAGGAGGGGGAGRRRRRAADDVDKRPYRGPSTGEELRKRG
jgi:hypothetical protein